MKKSILVLIIISLLAIASIAFAGHSYHYKDKDDKTCDVPIPPTPVLGCMDSTATNYNSLATQSDDSCIYPPPVVAPVLGCTNNTATNYNPLATQDDGSCTQPTPPGGSDDTTPPVIPPVTPPDNPPSDGGSNDVTPPIIPVETPPSSSGGGGGSATTPVISGGGYGGHPPIIPITLPTPTIENPIITTPDCIPVTNLIIENGVPNDGIVGVRWQGGDDVKYFVYGTNPEALDNFVQVTDNSILLHGLKSVNYWFAVSNNCSATPLIDPIP